MVKRSRSFKGFLTRIAPYFLAAGLLALIVQMVRGWRTQRALLGQGRPQPAVPDAGQWPDRPRVSALVAAWNESRYIESHIRSFLALSYPNRQLIVCAGGTDGTYALAAHLAGPQVVVIEQQPGEGKQKALQRCLECADGEIVLLSDADCLYDENAFLHLIEPLACGETQVVTGVAEPRLELRTSPLVQYQRYGDLIWAHQMPRRVDGLLGRNCALTRSALETVDEFRTPVQTGTDYYLSRRLVQAGYTIRAAPESSLQTEYPDTPQAYVRQWRRWNKNLLVHGIRFRAWNDLRGLAMSVSLYSLTVFGAALTPLLGPLAWMLSLLLFAAAVASRAQRTLLGARLAGERLSPACLWQMPFFTLLDMLAVLLAVRDAASPRYRKVW